MKLKVLPKVLPVRKTELINVVMKLLQIYFRKKIKNQYIYNNRVYK